MSRPGSDEIGFTLIELMVSMAVLAILLVVAVPSFNEFRQRSALRGAADQVASFWGDARFEALRRNSLVKVGFKVDGDSFCLGAATTTNAADNVPCDCLTAGACNVSSYPADQDEWRRVRVRAVADSAASADWLGGDAAAAVAVIDPKRANITDSADDGMIFLKSPSGGAEFWLNVFVDRNGRAFICEPSAAPKKIPGYSNRSC